MEQICFANISASACLYSKHHAFVIAAQMAKLERVANAKFTWVGPGFKSMRSNCELTADLLMVPLGAQTGYSIVGLLQVVFEQSHWIFLWFSRDAFNLPENEGHCKSVCMQMHFGFHWVDGKFAALSCVASFELLPHLCLGLERTKPASPYMLESNEGRTLFSVFYLPVVTRGLILSFLSPGANRWPTQMTCRRSLWSSYL